MKGLDVDIRLSRGNFELAAKFTAPADGITVLFGPSGSGKSSLLAAIAGLTPAEGHIKLGKHALSDSGKGLELPPHRRGIGMVFQDARLFPHLTVRDNIAYAWKRAPADKRPAQDALARFFDIQSLLERPVGNLSGGEKSRVALARALAAAPDFLLLDEPFAALDGVRRRAFIRVLLEMHKNFHLPMLAVTHNIDDAAAMASSLVALQDGKVVAAGPFDQAVRDPAFAGLLDPQDSGAAISALLLHSGRDQAQRFLWLRADHIVLATEPPKAVSARNILEGEITQVRRENDGSRIVELLTPAGPLLSRVTAEAVEELGLRQGRRAWALVKVHALQS
ncbi:MAG TPA: ATP-binding cassette domain-containing protein [Rhizomicrobium sp.]|nr:ATP-binding cassette domain-containing protein [Rhizomicrobium sp.]